MKKVIMKFSSTIDEGDHLKVKDGIRGIILFGIRKGILTLGTESTPALISNDPGWSPGMDIPLERSNELILDKVGGL